MNKTETKLAVEERDRKALEALVVDNPDLEHLEALLDQFNLFEAIGAVRQELRHSDFLAFLLNPRENHGLGDVFLKRLLQKVLVAAPDTSTPVSPIDLDVWDLDQAFVLREWQNIDILLLDEAHQLALIIENKIDSSEHSNQLSRYHQIVSQNYSSWSIIALYLTPEREIPSDERYLPVDYRLVCELVESLADSRASTLGTDVRTLMIHYAQMLRRHIVNESEIAGLYRRIYQKHQRALDLIYEHRPDQQADIQEILEGLIKQTPDLNLDQGSKTYIRFAAKEWEVPVLRSGIGWTSSGRILLFEFVNEPKKLRLKLHIGPGPDETRQKLFDMASNKRPPFQVQAKALNRKWNEIFARSFLNPKSYEETDTGELEPEIRKQWDRFVKDDLPMIKAAIKAEQWIWQPASNEMRE